MKERHMHHKHHHPGGQGLDSLLDRCGHYLSHRIGGKKRGQEGILSIIAQEPGITQKALAEKLGIQPASVSELLMKLEQKGLILREKDEQDRRSMKVRLSEAGGSFLAAPRQEPSDPFQVLTAEEQEQLRCLLTKLLTHWEQQYPAEHRRHKHHHHDHDKEDHNGIHE